MADLNRKQNILKTNIKLVAFDASKCLPPILRSGHHFVIVIFVMNKYLVFSSFFFLFPFREIVCVIQQRSFHQQEQNTLVSLAEKEVRVCPKTFETINNSSSSSHTHTHRRAHVRDTRGYG